jgi:Kdo2-lipid IVA lauroyltransferase/acyltransferase
MIALKRAATQLIYGLAFAMGLIPRQWSFKIARAIGSAWFLLDRRHRTVALDNLTGAYAGEKSSRQINVLARAVFGNIVLIPFEIGWSLRLSKADIRRHIQIRGFSHLREAHARGKGVLILTLHIGNWEMLASSLIPDHFRVSMVYRPMKFEPADRFFLEYRSRNNATPIPKKKSMRKLFNALKRQECVGVLLDQDSGFTAGVFADFFGRPACTNKGLALLASRTGSPVLPLFCVRQGKGFLIEIGPEIPLIRTDDKETDLQRNTAKYNQVLEGIIRRYPEQWFWVHQRWKTRPRKPRQTDSCAG